MAALTATAVASAVGVADLAGAAVAASAGGDTSPVGPGYALLVFNGDAAPHTATIATPGTVEGHAVADGALTVAAGDTGMIALTNVYRGADNLAAITYDDVTAVTVLVIKLGA